MLDASLSVDAADDAVTFELAVTNTGDDPVDLSFRTSQRAEFTVYPADAGTETEPVWQASEGRMFAQMLGSETVEPGEEVVYRDEWPGPAPGEYRAIGEVVCTGHDIEAAATFEV